MDHSYYSLFTNSSLFEIQMYGTSFWQVDGAAVYYRKASHVQPFER